MTLDPKIGNGVDVNLIQQFGEVTHFETNTWAKHANNVTAIKIEFHPT